MKIFLLVFSIGLVALIASYIWDEKKSKLYPKEFVLDWGNRMKNSPNGGPGRGCFPTNFSTYEYPELKEELLEAKKLVVYQKVC